MSMNRIRNGYGSRRLACAVAGWIAMLSGGSLPGFAQDSQPASDQAGAAETAQTPASRPSRAGARRITPRPRAVPSTQPAASQPAVAEAAVSQPDGEVADASPLTTQEGRERFERYREAADLARQAAEASQPTPDAVPPSSAPAPVLPPAAGDDASAPANESEAGDVAESQPAAAPRPTARERQEEIRARARERQERLRAAQAARSRPANGDGESSTDENRENGENGETVDESPDAEGRVREERRPVEPPPAPQDGKTEWFSFSDTQWEEVVNHFAERLGKPLLSTDVYVPGSLNFQTTRRYTKDEAIDELNYLLVEQGYYLHETDNYVYLLPLNELSKYIEPKYIFESMEAFTGAALRDMQFSQVFIRIEDRPAEAIRDMLAPAMPDHALPVVAGETNSIKLTGLARDVRRFAALLDRFKGEKFDPRTMRIFEIKTRASDIADMVRTLLGVEQPRRTFNRETRQWETAGGESGSNVRIIPDERTNTLIVKGTPAELKEVEEFINALDKKKDIGEFKTHVIEVTHGNAREIRDLLNSIFQQERGPSSGRSSFAGRQRTVPGQRNVPQPNQVNPEEIFVEDIFEQAKKTIRLEADERTNSLIVYANDDGATRVREMLEVLDKPVASNYRVFKLENASAEEIQPTVQQIATGLGAVGGGRGAARGPTVVLDQANNALHVIAEREAMQRIESIIDELDLAAPDDQRHVIELRNLTPSRVAQMIQPILLDAASATPRGGRRGASGGRTAPTSQIIPLDESNTLIVICGDEEWAKVEQIIDIADDGAVSDRPETRFYTVENATPTALATTLGALYRNYQYPGIPRTQVLVDTFDNQIVVQAIRPAHEEIDALLRQLDVVPSEDPVTILPLVSADAAQVAEVAQGLLPPDARGGGRRGGGGGAAGMMVQAEPVTNSLIVKADRLTLDRIKAFAADMENQVAAQKPERRFYTLRNAAPRDVVGAIGELFSASSARRGGRGGPVGTQVNAIVVGSQVVCDAPAVKQAEIASLIEQLDAASDLGVTSVLVKLPGSNVQTIAQRLSGAFQERVRQQGVVARFEADAATETILMTVSREAIEEANRLLDEYRAASAEVASQTEFYQLRHAAANEVAGWLRDELVTMMNKQFGRAAAEQVKVTPDARTNRVIISAPQIAVRAAMPLLEQFDVPMNVTDEATPPPIATDTRRLPGMNVQGLATQLNAAFRAQPPRPDRLSFNFGADPATETLFYTVPKDSLALVEDLIAKFVAESADLAPEQRIFAAQHADAPYLSNQLRAILAERVAGRLGRDAASRISIIPDARLNSVVINAPRVAMEMAEALLAELDREAVAGSQLETIPLANADVNTMLGVLNTIFREKIQARTLQVSAEPLTNALIVGGTESDVAEIRRWATDLDAQAVEAVSDPQIYELKNANPWEVFNVLQATYQQRAAGRRVRPGQEMKFNVIAGRSLVVQAPADKLPEIEALINELDSVGANESIVRTYQVPGMGTNLNNLARQIQDAVNARLDQRDQRVTVTPVPSADALIVTALESQLEWVERAMEQFKNLNQPPQIATIPLTHADAGLVAQALQKVLQSKIQSGRVQITPETMTNSLVVAATEEDMAEIRTWAAEFDASVVATDNIATIDIRFGDPGQIANMISQVFSPPRGSQRAPTQEVKVTVSGSKLIVSAPPAKLESIRQLVATVDAESDDDVEVKMYTLKVMNAGMVAAQVSGLLRTMFPPRAGALQPAAFAEPSTNTLVVLAPPDRLPMIDGLIAKIESSPDRPIAEPQAYVLTNARADQVARNVEQMLRAKITEQEGARASAVQLTVSHDPAANRLIVFAPGDYQELAGELIRMIDQNVETGDLVHIVRIEQGDAQQVLTTLTQTLQGRAGRTGGTMRVTLAADAASNSLIISGLPKDVADAEKLATELDAVSQNVPELQIFQLKNASALDVADALTGMVGGGSPRDQVTVTSDEYYNRLIVTGNKRSMRIVEAFISQLDAPPETGESGIAGGREIYFVDVVRGDAFDIAWEVSDFFPPEDRGGPSIDSDWFGEYIRVVCRPSEYPQIQKLIQEFDRRAKPEMKIKFLKPRSDLAKLLPLLQANEPGLQIEHAAGQTATETIVEDLWPEDEPARPGAGSGGRGAGGAEPLPPGVMPFMAGPAMLAQLHALLDDSVPAVSSLLPQRVEAPQDAPGAAASQPVDPPIRREPVKISVMPDGQIAIAGAETQVTEIEDAIALLEEDMRVGEIIRIFRFRHGDVNAAARIVDLMFNERQANIRLPQQLLQAQQRGRGGRGEEDDEGGDERGGIMDQLRGAIGGAAGGRGAAGAQRDASATGGTGQRIRIATDAAHNYLILKCEENLLPEIRQLLRELDIPPAEVDVNVFQLKNLDAAETANNIREVLGIGQQRGGQGGRGSQVPQQLRGSQQGMLLELLQQQMFSMPGGDGGSAKVELVQVVANQITNSLLVSAPPDVMKLISKVVAELEELEGRDVTVIRRRVLETARLDDVLPLLQEIFAGAAGGGGRAARSSPADLGPVNVAGDPRANAIIYTCQAKDAKTVEEQIAALDIEGDLSEAETYVCEFGDAASIAQTVSELFLRGATPAGGRRGGGAAPAQSLSDARIAVEPTTNTIIVFGSLAQRDLVFQKVEELDKLSRRDVREIPVAFADPEKLADKLTSIFGGTAIGETARAGRGARTQLASTAGRIVLVGDKNSMKLLVRAPDPVFEQMQDLVALLDQPNEQLQIRSFVLQHADAATVVESVKSAMVEYMGLVRQQGGESDFDAFTAVADPRTNSVMVVGSVETFAFVKQILDTVDVATPAEQQKQFRIFVLDTADAATVADAINAFAAGGDVSATASPGGRAGAARRGAGGLPGGAGLSAKQIDVNAVADTTTNSVLVYGRSEDIDRIQMEVIAKLDSAVADHRHIARIPVTNALPSQVASYVQQLLDEAAATGQGRGGASGVAGPSPATILPNDNAGTIVVYGSRAQIARIESLAKEFDTQDLMSDTVKIIQVPYGQDPVALARTVEQLVNNGEQIRADQSRRPARLVSVAADSYANALMVYGDSSQYAIVEAVVSQLAEIRPSRPVTQIIQLANLSSEEARALIDDLNRRRSGGATGTGGAVRPTGGFAPPSGSRGTPPSQGNTPRRPPTGGSRRGGGGGGVNLWVPPAERALIESVPAHRAAAGWPFIGTAVFHPAMGSLFAAAQAAVAPQAQPPAEEPTTPASAPAGEVAGLTGVSGELRGDVAATPLDSRQLIVTGDQEDVDFIVQMLALMDATTPQGKLKVFILQHAKAPAIGPIVQQTMQAWIEQKSGTTERGDRFSIIAEGRSNSLIVTASEPNLELIGEIIAQLDVDTLTGTEFRAILLNHIRAAEAAGILRPVIERLNAQRQVPTEAAASIEAIERSNSLLVVGTPADIAEIERLIQGIDVELPPEQSFTTARVLIVELKNAAAETLAETLNTLIEVERATSTGAAGGGARAGATGGALVRKLLMSTTDGRDLPALDLDKPIRILPEKGKNALVVFSTPQNNEALSEIIGLFDSLPVGNEIEVKSFALAHAAAEPVSQTLQRMFDESKKALQRASNLGSTSFADGEMPPVPPGITAQGLPYNVTVTFDARSNSVLVVGHKDAVLLAAGIIRELDRPSAELNLQPFVVALKNIPAGKLKEQLDEMLQSRLEALGGDQNQARDSAILMTDERSNALIVLSTPDMHGMIAGLATQLDAATSYRAVDSRYLRLEYADAAKLQGLLQELFDRKQEAAERTETQTRDVLFVLSDARSNSLMLTGTRDYLREAEDLVSQLDTAFDPTVEFKLRPVLLNSAANIAALLTDMIDKSRSEQDEATRGSPIHVSADPYSNNLLLAASREDMLMLERWISVLDKPAEPGRITQILPMRRGDAEEVSQRAQELFGGSAQGAESDVTVTFDPTTNAIVAIGPPAVVRDIADFVARLDTTEALSNAIVRIFKLEQADAEDAGELLRNIIEGRGGSVGGTGGGSSQSDAVKQVMLIYQSQHPELGAETLKAMRAEIVVIDDIRTNSLVVTAPPESMALVESLVKAIDQPPDAAKIRVFPLRNSDASEMVETLQTLFEESAQGGQTGGPGGQDAQERILTLEGGAAAGGRQQLSFTADLRTNSIIAAGTVGYLDLVEELILEIDSRPIEPRKTLVYAPRNNEAVAIQQAIADYNDRETELLDELGAEISASRKLERNIQAVASEDTNRIILNYDARRESEVLDLVRELDQPPPQVMIQVLIVEVTMDNRLELGVEFAFQDLQFTKAGPTDTTTFDYVGGTDIGAVGAGLGGFTFTITGQDFNFLLRTLQNEGSLNVLSRPQIVAMDNQDARIEITRDVPYPSGTATVAGQTTTTVQRQDVGIILEVTPHINPDGFVRMEIRQEVSDLTGSTVDVGPGVTAPIFFKREAETVVTVRDNETVVLGGLITRRDEDREQKVPILGDIPLLGLAFRNDVTTSERTELLVILTPRVVRTVEDYRELSIEQRDQAKVIPGDFLTDPLMNKLRVEPEALVPPEERPLLEPFPIDIPEEPATPTEEPYGPTPRPAAKPPARPSDEDSYDVPYSGAASAGAATGAAGA